MFREGEGVDQLLCVQSMDGQLSFFQHECPTFTCFLPDFLLPGPLSYIQYTCSLVTVNSAHTVQVFKWVSIHCLDLRRHHYPSPICRYHNLSMAGSGLTAASEEQAEERGKPVTLGPPTASSNPTAARKISVSGRIMWL